MTALELRVYVLANEDRPGIAKIMVGDQLLFDAGSEKVIQTEVRVAVPVHLHLDEPRLACIWKE